MSAYIIDLTEDFTDVRAALRKLEFSVATARNCGNNYIKVIHSADTHGSLGALKREARKFLRSYKKAGKIRLMICGEKFAEEDDATRYMIDKCPDAATDPDIGKGNAGVAIVLI